MEWPKLRVKVVDVRSLDDLSRVRCEGEVLLVSLEVYRLLLERRPDLLKECTIIIEGDNVYEQSS